MKNLSKKEKRLLQKRKEFNLTTWATFIIGIAFSLGGLRRFFTGYPIVMMNPKTNYPLLDDGSYPIFIGILFIILSLYRVFFLKKTLS